MVNRDELRQRYKDDERFRAMVQALVPVLRLQNYSSLDIEQAGDAAALIVQAEREKQGPALSDKPTVARTTTVNQSTGELFENSQFGHVG